MIELQLFQLKFFDRLILIFGCEAYSVKGMKPKTLSKIP